MATTKRNDTILTRSFDRKACRHHLNGRLVVLHCHHYASLYSQLAEDCGMLDGAKLLADVTEDTASAWLAEYYAEQGIKSLEHRLAIAAEYYSIMGLGKMTFVYAGPDSAYVELSRSHVDEGWIKKWGKRGKPVNFITRGYVAGALAAVFGTPARSFVVTETASIVTGADTSKFRAVRA
jgi:predicted hydrocarbon binding protein